MKQQPCASSRRPSRLCRLLLCVFTVKLALLGLMLFDPALPDMRSFIPGMAPAAEAAAGGVAQAATGDGAAGAPPAVPTTVPSTLPSIGAQTQAPPSGQATPRVRDYLPPRARATPRARVFLPLRAWAARRERGCLPPPASSNSVPCPASTPTLLPPRRAALPARTPASRWTVWPAGRKNLAAKSRNCVFWKVKSTPSWNSCKCWKTVLPQ